MRTDHKHDTNNSFDFTIVMENLASMKTQFRNHDKKQEIFN